MNVLLLEALSTPELLLDLDAMERNAQRMRDHVRTLGLDFRPHVKTAKCIEVVERMLGEGPRRIAVSTLREAEWFLTRGVSDILYAVGVVPARFERLSRLVRAGADLTLVVDSAAVVVALAAFASAENLVFRVLVELDVGAGRAGVSPDSAELLEIATLIAACPSLRLSGVMTHAGHAYGAADLEDRRRIARAEAAMAAHAADRLRLSGLPVDIVSIGSTPSIDALDERLGATEARTGVYIFNDLDQLKLGVCQRSDLALTVLSRVVGHNRAAGRLLIDAGILALSKDRGLTPSGVPSYGEICDPKTLLPIEGLTLSNLNQEHGIAEVADEGVYERLPVGALVRVVPNHACITAAAFQGYALVRGDQVVDRWARDNGW
ncbi:alanine racemase [Phenylobacterium sp.]|uniref:alanine racemase n=1 Tax=Phenylobacterium sp. TaxID=1871053 RepID=UPI002FC9F59B